MIRIILLALLLSACGTTKYITVEKPVITYVKVKEPCPNAVERARLKAARPIPLRDTPMPDSDVERVGKSQAQLGKYEATGGWADQVDAALDRCQEK